MKQRGLVNELIEMGWGAEEFSERLTSLKKRNEEENKLKQQEKREKYVKTLVG